MPRSRQSGGQAQTHHESDDVMEKTSVFHFDHENKVSMDGSMQLYWQEQYDLPISELLTNAKRLNTVKPWIASNLCCKCSARQANVSNKF